MHDFYITKFFQRLVFGRNGNGSIFLTVVVFLLNLAAVMAIDCLLIYNIPTFTPEGWTAQDSLQLGPDFSGHFEGVILDIYGTQEGYHVLYQEENGEKKLVEVISNPISHRFRINKSTEMVIPDQEHYEYDSGPGLTQLKFTVENNQIKNVSYFQSGLILNSRSSFLNIYMFIALLALLLEYFILKKLKGED